MEVKEIADWLTVIGWFTAGIWFIRQHILKREDFARINVNASLRQVAKRGNDRVVEVIAEVENTGEVRHYLENITYTIRGSDMQELKSKPEILDQVDLPIEVVEDRRFFPTGWKYSFVDAGQISRYRHLIIVPRRVKLAQLVVKMPYKEKKSDFHTATWFGTLE